MKPATVAREVHSSAALSQTHFGISLGDQAHILSILHDKLYSNKPLAVLREYSANAWDAHREVGKHETPIRIVLPTELDSTLIIRDFGPGLSEADVYNVFVRYGASTKRDTNSQVGAFGIGGKSAFAYNDQFTVTSWHGGMKRVFSAVLDETNMGTMSKMWEGPCDPSETGIQIKVPVSRKDIQRFYAEARQLYPWFSPLPDINLELPNPKKGQVLTEAGFISKTSFTFTRWVAVMGCVPYRLDWSRFSEELQEDEALMQAVNKLHGALFFDIGDVDVSASREDLEYTDRTQKAILGRISALSDALSKDLDDKLKACESFYDRRIVMRQYMEDVGLPPPDRFAVYKSFRIRMYDRAVEESVPKSFRLYKIEREYNRGKYKLSLKHSPYVPVDAMTRVYVRDSKQSLRGFLGERVNHVVLVVPHSEAILDPKTQKVLSRKEYTPEEALAEFEALLEAKKATGVSVKMLTDLPYTPVYRSDYRRSKNSKHSKRMFKLKRYDYWRTPNRASDAWEIAGEMPDGAIFTILNRFSPEEGSEFFRNIYQDAGVAKLVFNEPMPDIYGVKTTEKEPVERKDLDGIHYEDWARAKFTEWMQDKAARDAVESLWWRDHQFWQHNERLARATFEWLRNDSGLDGRHRVVHVFRKLCETYDMFRGLNDEQITALRWLAERWDHFRRTEPDKRVKKSKKKRKRYIPPRHVDATLDAFFERYPLLNRRNEGPGFSAFTNRNVRHLWVEYLQVIDTKLKQKQ